MTDIDLGVSSDPESMTLLEAVVRECSIIRIYQFLGEAGPSDGEGYLRSPAGGEGDLQDCVVCLPVGRV